MISRAKVTTYFIISRKVWTTYTQATSFFKDPVLLGEWEKVMAELSEAF